MTESEKKLVILAGVCVGVGLFGNREQKKKLMDSIDRIIAQRNQTQKDKNFQDKNSQQETPVETIDVEAQVIEPVKPSAFRKAFISLFGLH